jgi:hypothetical protein
MEWVKVVPQRAKPARQALVAPKLEAIASVSLKAPVLSRRLTPERLPRRLQVDPPKASC